MSRIIFFSFLIFSILGCLPDRPKEKAAPCCTSTKQLYDSLISAVNSSRYGDASKLYSSDAMEQDVKYFYGVDRPKLSFVPKDSAGAYGLIEKKRYDMYYTKFKYKNSPDSIRVILIGKYVGDSCYKIVNIAPVTPTSEKLIKN